MKEYIIRETDDFLSLSTLFHESGMGVNIEERMPDRVIKMWRMDNARTGELMAAVTLEIRDGAYSLGDIAVRDTVQKNHAVYRFRRSENARRQRNLGLRQGARILYSLWLGKNGLGGLS